MLLLAAPGWTTPAVGSGSNGPPTTDEKDTEYRVKSAFIYNFIRYTTWPKRVFEKRDSPIVVLVIGESAIRKHLGAALEDKVVDGRKIELRYERTMPRRIDAHVVFEGELSEKDQKKLLEACHKQPVLLSGERPGFAKLGAQCNFYLDEGKVRFEINVDAVADSELVISSQLLKLARLIRKEER